MQRKFPCPRFDTQARDAVQPDLSILKDSNIAGVTRYRQEGFLPAGAQEEQCGWLKDRFGISWQIVPADVGSMLQASDAEKVQRVTQALLQMVKLDIGALRIAYESEV